MKQCQYINKLQGEGEEIPPLGKFLGGEPPFKVLYIIILEMHHQSY